METSGRTIGSERRAGGYDDPMQVLHATECLNAMIGTGSLSKTIGRTPAETDYIIRVPRVDIRYAFRPDPFAAIRF